MAILIQSSKTIIDKNMKMDFYKKIFQGPNMERNESNGLYPCMLVRYTLHIYKTIYLNKIKR